MKLNIAAYHFVPIADVPALAARMRTECQARGLRGSVLVAGEGINLFLAGDEDAVRGFLDWLRADPRFSGIVAKESWSRHVPFARLKVKRKREIVSFAGRPAGIGEARVPSVAAKTLARWIEAGHDDAGKPLLLLDTRNREEIGYGTFRGARTLPIDNFNDLPAAVEAIRGELRDATVVSFCTGGIRCEKAAPWMRDIGLENVSQLEGGILRYFEEVGGMGYEGGCFVFDERIALDPELRPLRDEPVIAPPVRQ
ncbi:sulfurtransferase [Lysobacter pythonis]|uniref:Sulfurtransferase n=1 Tax=Solilutibacter pythonis TaxID=2483112 RepID=A0A3M2HSS9_9GAMM|nr:sulfurtransferase [Lysobacter pythonis]RMH90883.1 sulfurtransferase [Lysobacter pythonis]